MMQEPESSSNKEKSITEKLLSFNQLIGLPQTDMYAAPTGSKPQEQRESPPEHLPPSPQLQHNPSVPISASPQPQPQPLSQQPQLQQPQPQQPSPQSLQVQFSEFEHAPSSLQQQQHLMQQHQQEQQLQQLLLQQQQFQQQQSLQQQQLMGSLGGFVQEIQRNESSSQEGAVPLVHLPLSNTQSPQQSDQGFNEQILSLFRRFENQFHLQNQYLRSMNERLQKIELFSKRMSELFEQKLEKDEERSKAQQKQQAPTPQISAPIGVTYPPMPGAQPMVMLAPPTSGFFMPPFQNYPSVSSQPFVIQQSPGTTSTQQSQPSQQTPQLQVYPSPSESSQQRSSQKVDYPTVQKISQLEPEYKEDKEEEQSPPQHQQTTLPSPQMIIPPPNTNQPNPEPVLSPSELQQQQQILLQIQQQMQQQQLQQQLYQQQYQTQMQRRQPQTTQRQPPQSTQPDKKRSGLYNLFFGSEQRRAETNGRVQQQPQTQQTVQQQILQQQQPTYLSYPGLQQPVYYVQKGPTSTHVQQTSQNVFPN